MAATVNEAHSTASDLLQQAERAVADRFREIQEVARANQRRVLQAFWAHRVGSHDLVGSTGYGLGDGGRDKFEHVFAQVFETEAALVRPQIISGTHAIRLGLFGILRPGDHFIYATGRPYDTLEAVLGLRPTPGSLAEWGVTHTLVPLTLDGQLDMAAVAQAVGPKTKLVMFQRSRGYSERSALGVDTLAAAFATLRQACPDVLIGVDNCYGEFTELHEPTAVGADLAMGSLIKNPGGGLAPTGGYVTGRADLVELAATQLTAPGLGGEMGPTHDFLRLFYQGLFLAPHTVGQALQGSVLAAYAFEALGLTVSPRWHEPRADLIMSIQFSAAEPLLAFCRAVQASAPIDSYVVPQAAPMAGYGDAVVMAAGTFIQGASLEMSADAPLRAPYRGYFQGGLTYEHVWVAMEQVLEALFTSQA